MLTEFGNVIIKLCANGYLVIVPIERNPYGNSFAPGMKEVIQEVTGDDMLDKLREQAIDDEKKELKMMKDDGIYVFKTFREVLTFLREKIKDPIPQ